MIEWKRVAQQYGCTTCGAAPGEPCVTTGNRDAHTPHQVRSTLASADGWVLFDDEEESDD